MAPTLAEIAPLFRKNVTLMVRAGHASDGSDSVTDITGKVLEVSANGVVVRYRGNPMVVALSEISTFEEVVRPRRKRVVRRAVRRIPEETSVKQHLADRHGILVSVLNAVPEETARMMHDHINHSDLGHYHREPEEMLGELGEAPSDDTDDLDDDE